LAELDDTIAQLEDHQMSIQTLMGHKHVSEIRDVVEKWEKKLSRVSDIIDEWLTFQRQWMYLENIFNAEDIQKQLPNEAKSFMTVDKFWKARMIQTKQNPLIIEICESEGLLLKFQQSNKALEEI